MALTDTFKLTALEIVVSALRKLGVVAQGESPDASQSNEGYEALKVITKELNAFSLCRWKVNHKLLNLVAGTNYYTVGTPPTGLSNNIHKLIFVNHSTTDADNTGIDTPVEIVDAIKFQSIREKATPGIVSMCYLVDSSDLAQKGLSVYPTPQSGTPGFLDYAYEATVQVIGAPTDTLDVPMEWQRYITLRLASDLAHEYGISVNDIQLLETKCDKALAILNYDQFYQYEKIKHARNVPAR